MGMIQPVYAIGLAIVILGEFPTLLEIAGGVIILGAASWATIAAQDGKPKPAG
jgi:drug/metabolite transporter (DMT)-like permease